MFGGFPLALNDALLTRVSDLLDELDSRPHYAFWKAEEQILLDLQHGLREAELVIA